MTFNFNDVQFYFKLSINEPNMEFPIISGVRVSFHGVVANVLDSDILTS